MTYRFHRYDPHINPNASSEVRLMISPLLDKVPYGAYAILLGMVMRFLYRHIRPWIKTRKEMPSNQPKTRRQTFSFLSALVFACAATFGLLLLLAVTLPQTSPRTPIVLLLAGGVGALGVIGVLLLVLGVPAYNRVSDLDDRLQNLEDQYPSLDHQNQILEYRCRSLEDRNQKLEERVKTIELQDQAQNGLREEQFPLQRNLAFMEMWSVQKRDHDTDLIKQSKADVGRLAG